MHTNSNAAYDLVKLELLEDNNTMVLSVSFPFVRNIDKTAEKAMDRLYDIMTRHRDGTLEYKEKTVTWDQRACAHRWTFIDGFCAKSGCIC